MSPAQVTQRLLPLVDWLTVLQAAMNLADAPTFRGWYPCIVLLTIYKLPNSATLSFKSCRLFWQGLHSHDACFKQDKVYVLYCPFYQWKLSCRRTACTLLRQLLWSEKCRLCDRVLTFNCISVLSENYGVLCTKPIRRPPPPHKSNFACHQKFTFAWVGEGGGEASKRVNFTLWNNKNREN